MFVLCPCFYLPIKEGCLLSVLAYGCSFSLSEYAFLCHILFPRFWTFPLVLFSLPLPYFVSLPSRLQGVNSGIGW